MKFNLKELNPGTWFYFNEDKPDDGRISIRILNSEKLAQIRSDTVKTNVEYRDGKRHEWQTINHNARDEIIWDYCIVDWEGLVDDDEYTIECTKENKIKLMNEHIGFANFVENCLTKLNQDAELRLENSEKN